MGAVVNLLAIESATDLVGAAVVTSEGRIFERSHAGGRQHAELLAPSVDAVCHEAALAVADLDAVAVDIGPGLFTGLRVGVATAKALAQGLGVGLVGVTSLDVLAADAVARVAAGTMTGQVGDLTVVAVVDARRGEVFVARYRFGSPSGGRPAAGTGTAGAGGGPGTLVEDPAHSPVAGPELLVPEVLAASLAAGPPGGGRTVVVGGGTLRYRDLLRAVPGVDLSVAEEVRAPSPVVLARLALARLEAGEPLVAPVDLVPEYRRDADAKINWEQRAPVVPGSPVAPPTPR